MPKSSASPAADWPPADVLLGAWRRLLDHPDTAGEFAALVLVPLASDLAARQRRADPADVTTAAGDAILAFLKRPEAYDPARMPLASYLLLIAKRRLLNQFASERKHHAGRIPWDCVELGVAGRNEEGADDTLDLDAPELAAVRSQFTDAEQRVWQLMRGGGRRTVEFAEVLGVAGDPDAAAHVKRVKDRILARLKRAAGAIMTNAVHDLARRAAVDPHFLAFALAEYAARESLDEAGLLAALGATPEALASARLCRTPRSDPDGFRADTDRIAAKFALDRDALAKAARHGLVVAELRRAATESSAEAAAFLAARDRNQ